jgi:ABC-type nitrate/sulfonate/bicarbonate transport system ATPase subunit
MKKLKTKEWLFEWKDNRGNVYSEMEIWCCGKEKAKEIAEKLLAECSIEGVTKITYKLVK